MNSHVAEKRLPVNTTAWSSTSDRLGGYWSVLCHPFHHYNHYNNPALCIVCVDSHLIVTDGQYGFMAVDGTQKGPLGHGEELQD